MPRRPGRPAPRSRRSGCGRRRPRAGGASRPGGCAGRRRARIALADLVEAPEALGVHVQQLAGARALVAHHLRAAVGAGCREAPRAGEHLADRRGRDAEDRPQARRAVAAGRPGIQDPRLDARARRPRLAARDRAALDKARPAAGVIAGHQAVDGGAVDARAGGGRGPALIPWSRTLATISQRLSQDRRLRRGGRLASDIRVSLEVGR